MTTELRYLMCTAILTASLWLPVVIGYGQARGPLTPEDYRVARTTPLPDWVNRANRAHMNAVESFAPFAAVVLVAHVLDVHSAVTTTAAAVYFGARALHAVVHISGIGFLMARTVIFTIGWGAFIAMAVEVFRLAA
jgi:uncharacterized MAPEG superfamily protein